MAKHKRKHAGKSLKLPKSIAGVRIPKHLRKSSGSLTALLESPVGRQVAADVLLAAAAALTANRQSREAIGQAGSNTAGVLREVAGAAVGAVAEGVRNVLPGAEEPRRTGKPAPSTH